MNRHAHRGGRWLAVIALCGLVAPPSLWAGERPTAPVLSHKILDAKLDSDKLLRGTAVNSAGLPLANAMVTLAHRNEVQATATTNAKGEFAFRMQQGGVYQLAVGERIIPCRVWSPQLAPPAAKSALLLVTDAKLARGQRPLGEALFSTPVLIGVVVAAAVAIPLAISNTNDSTSGS